MTIREQFSSGMQNSACLNSSPKSRRHPAWIKCCDIVLALIALLCICISEAQAGDEIFIEPGSVWKYLDTGVDQGTAWRAPSFNDSTWASGPAELGYGDGDEMTVVGYGPSAGNKYITTYFRHSFNVTDASKFTSLLLRIWRDDGAIIYLNGVEVWRVNMPAGPVVFNTRALTGTFALETTTIGPSLLVNGTNVIAVEIHQLDRGSSDISFDFEISGSDPAIPATVKRGPYLQQGNSSSVIVRWRTDVATDSRVSYGTTLGNLNLTADDAAQTTEHEIRLSGLSPETTYYYSVGTMTRTLVGNNDSHFFITPPPGGTARATRIWALGDAGLASTGAKGVRNAYVKLAGVPYTNLWLMLGNNAYNSGLDNEYQEKVFEFYQRILRKTVLWPTLGDHDAGGSPNPPSSLPYFNIFSLPTGGEVGGLASATEKYYSFNYGNIHFICLDSMTSSRSATGPMANWLRNDLSANLQPWVIAYWNHPPYSRGSTNSDSRSELIQMRQNIVPILEAAGVDLVISAQSHSYERSFLIDGHYGLSSTFNDSMKKNGGDGRVSGNGGYTKAAGIVPRGGTVYVVAGSGGTTGGGLLNHPAMFMSSNTYGSLVLDIDGNRLDARFLRNDGVVADNFTIIKETTSTLPPADPTSLTATAISGSQINLAWTDNSNNEDGFRIEQSTDGVTFTPAATTGADVTTRSI
ncbi:MAG: metallophosphoesterase family protein, partial [Acidobacteria bacterium]|nr:metallophosphoesterase family protein [Acidobacteriota bacterium]